jgi:membrane-bound lytic murein transglycosylase D
MKWLTLLAFGLLISGCASTQKQENVALNMAPGSPEMARLQEKSTLGPSSGDLNDNESDMQNLPEDMNEKVTQWIEYFQGRGRPHMQKYLSRSSRYLPRMKEILKSHGLPEDLVYIALIESGFNSSAHSSARAVGYWQFIRDTGRRYGLEQNYYIDERRDFEASTEAAAKYLKALYNLFGSWYLAIASYNVGENRIKNLVMKHYTRDFWELAKQKHLPRETQNYVPKFLAARLIAKHPQKYGFENVDWRAPLDYKEIEVNNKGVNLKKMAQHLGIPKAELFALNPSFKKGIIPKRKLNSKLRVPSYFVDEKIQWALNQSISKVTMTAATGADRNYRIRRGDTLSHIARRFNTSIRDLREANNLSRRSILYPGKKIIIPGSTRRSVAKSSSGAVNLQKGERSYTVREGDNLYTIAKRFNVSLSGIKKRNRLGRRSLLNIGKVLVIPASK